METRSSSRRDGWEAATMSPTSQIKYPVSIYKVALCNNHMCKVRMLINNPKTQFKQSRGPSHTSGLAIGTCKTRTDTVKETKIITPFRLTISLSTLKMKCGSLMQSRTLILKCKQLSPLFVKMKQMIRSCELKFYVIRWKECLYLFWPSLRIVRATFPTRSKLFCSLICIQLWRSNTKINTSNVGNY